MSRLSFRPRPLDIHKKLPIVKSVKEFEDDEALITTTSIRNSQLHRFSFENDNGAPPTLRKRNAQEIPTPQFSVVDSYERDYGRTFAQSTSYIRARGARSEIGEFVEYDIDNEDEDWLEEFNNEKKTLSPEKFETLLFKLEIMDHKAREKAGLVAPTFGSPIPVLLQLDTATEVMLSLSVRFAVLQSVYSYWKAKREHWQKPILRRLQPPPPVNDTNPYNVFRPREKAHRLHTRRMQRRENNVQSFEKLRQVRRSLEQAKSVMLALIKREETNREIANCEISLQRAQLKYKNEAHLVEDGMAFPGSNHVSSKFTSSDEEDCMDSDETANGHPQFGPRTIHPKSAAAESKLFPVPPAAGIKREFKRRHLSNGWMQRRDSDDPVLLFTRPLDPDKLAAAGIIQPSASPTPSENGIATPPNRFHGRIGRGGRIIFDRWNPLA